MRKPQWYQGVAAFVVVMGPLANFAHVPAMERFKAKTVTSDVAAARRRARNDMGKVRYSPARGKMPAKSHVRFSNGRGAGGARGGWVNLERPRPRRPHRHESCRSPHPPAGAPASSFSRRHVRAGALVG